MTSISRTVKTVLVGGCFDVLHYGHIDFLTKASRCGDRLVVALESDTNVRQKKGPTRPIHSQQQRKFMLEALKPVHSVICLPEMKTDSDYENLVFSLHPAVIAVTEHDPFLSKKRAQAQKINAEVIIIPKVYTPSTTQLAKLLGLE